VISARARIRISTFLSIAAAIVLSLAAALLVLAPGMHPAPSPAAAAIDKTEHAQTIEAMRQRKRGRPMIAILALNEATEVTDFLVPYGVLQRLTSPMLPWWPSRRRSKVSTMPSVKPSPLFVAAASL
jgi:hypothetical protein